MIRKRVKCAILLFAAVTVISLRAAVAEEKFPDTPQSDFGAAPKITGTEDEPYPAPLPGDPLPQVTARSAVLVDAVTGEVIYGRDERSRRYPASTTKIMTLITAVTSGKVSLDDIVTVSLGAADTEGSTMWL